MWLSSLARVGVPVENGCWSRSAGRRIQCCSWMPSALSMSLVVPGSQSSAASVHTGHSSNVTQVQKLAHTRLPSVGFRSRSRLLAVSLQVTRVINQALGCITFCQACSCTRNPYEGCYQFCCNGLNLWTWSSVTSLLSVYVGDHWVIYSIYIIFSLSHSAAKHFWFRLWIRVKTGFAGFANPDSDSRTECTRFHWIQPEYRFAISRLSSRVRYDTIRDAILTCAQKLTWVSLIYRTESTTKKENRKKLLSKKRICSEVTVKIWSIHVVSPEEEKEGCGGKELQKRKV